MKFLKDFDWSFKSILKVLGLFLVGLAAIGLAVILVLATIRTVFNRGGGFDDEGYVTSTSSQGEYAPQEEAYDYDEGYDGGLFKSELDRADLGLLPPEPSSSPGANLEDFEVKEYNGWIDSRNLEEDCQLILDLKVREEVIFEYSDQDKHNCSFRFKVENEHVEEIVTLIEAMDPESFNLNIQTIKQAIDNQSDYLEILTSQLEATEVALQDALESYEEIQTIATRQGDTETLANVVLKRVEVINQLKNQRLNLENSTQASKQAKADQLDRLKYTSFNLSIYKDVILDWESIGESWKYEMRSLIDHFNLIVQGFSLILVKVLLSVVLGIVYLFLAMLVLKGVWAGFKKVWGIGRRN